jgi:protein-tyrosine phosphatase
MARLLEREGLADRVTLDSAGTGGWHVGAPPDPRSTAAAARRGVTLVGAARRVADGDFAAFDLLLAMDRSNLADLLALAATPADRAKVRLLRAFDPAAVAADDLDVPDPYYGGPHGFDLVLDVVEAACEGLLAELRADGRL